MPEQPSDSWTADRLRELRAEAAAVLESIAAQDSALRSAADQRAAAERYLRAGLQRHYLLGRAAAAHARAKPAPLALPRARRAWKARKDRLDTALREATASLVPAREAVAALQREFVIAAAQRAAASAELRRLTAECADARTELP